MNLITFKQIEDFVRAENVPLSEWEVMFARIRAQEVTRLKQENCVLRATKVLAEFQSRPKVSEAPLRPVYVEKANLHFNRDKIVSVLNGHPMSSAEIANRVVERFPDFDRGVVCATLSNLLQQGRVNRTGENQSFKYTKRCVNY